MYYLVAGLAGIAGIVSFVCFVLVVMAMFKAGDKTLGVVCIVLFCCFSVGQLIGLVTGWMNADRWNVRKIMPIYTGAYVVQSLLLTYLNMVGPPG
jgi:hypothetical protein